MWYPLGVVVPHSELRYPLGVVVPPSELWYPLGVVVPPHVLKLVMKQSRSNIIDSGDFIKKFKEIKEVLKDAVTVPAVVVVVSIQVSILDVGLEALRRTLDDRVNKKIGTNDLI